MACGSSHRKLGGGGFHRVGVQLDYEPEMEDTADMRAHASTKQRKGAVAAAAARSAHANMAREGEQVCGGSGLRGSFGRPKQGGRGSRLASS
jgi:hypothetical protein